jgi:hypothetical protein
VTEVTPNAARALALYARLRAGGARVTEAARLLVLALYLDPGSAVGLGGRGRLGTLLGGRLAELVRSELAAAVHWLRPPPAGAAASARSAAAPEAGDALVADAAALAAQEGAPLTTRHLVLSAWRQMRGGDIGRVVPSRLLLALAGGDPALARALYAEVVARPLHPPRALTAEERAAWEHSVLVVPGWDVPEPPLLVTG